MQNRRQQTPTRTHTTSNGGRRPSASKATKGQASQAARARRKPHARRAQNVKTSAYEKPPTTFSPLVFVAILALIVVGLITAQCVWETTAEKKHIESLPRYITYDVAKAAIECQEKFGHPAGSTIAQIICESGNGDQPSKLASDNHNLFGMKWSMDYDGNSEVVGPVSYYTGEEVNGQATTVTGSFIEFKSDVDCVFFRSRVFLQAPNYSDNELIKEAIANHDSGKMAEGLKDAGWATSSVYVSALKGNLDRYNLRRFDTMSVADLDALRRA